MNGLDLFLGGVLAIGVFRGFKTGAVLQIAGVAGWLLGFLVATAVMEPVGAVAAESLGVSERAGPVLGFVVAFGAVVAGLTAAAHVVRKTLTAIKLGGIDTLAGAGVGGLRSAFGLSVVMLMTAFAPTPGGEPILIGEDTREASVLYEPVEALAPVVWDVARTVTPGIQEAISDRLNTFDEAEATPESELPLGGDGPEGEGA